VKQYEYLIRKPDEIYELAADGWRLVTVSDGNAYLEREVTSKRETAEILADLEAMAAISEAQTTTWYLAICQDCGNPDRRRLPQPFLDENERDDWSYAHQKRTSHHVTSVTEVA